MNGESAKLMAAERGWLRHTPAKFSAEVISQLVQQNFDAGASLYLQGDEAGGVYYVVDGAVVVSIALGEVGPFVVHVGHAGSWFGEAAIITGQPRRVGLLARRATQAFFLPLPAIRKIVNDDPAAWRYFALLAVMNTDLALSSGMDLLIRDHDKRLVALLLRLGNCRLASPNDGHLSTIDVSQEDLAEMANLSRNATGAVLRSLEKKGLIDRSYRQIRIVAPARLRDALRGA
jgi:CRP/FNR family cyclic AMP-dependent transcriptional regulator